MKIFYVGRGLCLFILLLAPSLLAQTTTATVSTYHNVGDSDHADAVFSNFSGIGFGSSAQLSVDGHFGFTDTRTESSTNLGTSFRLFDVLGVGAGYRFGEKGGDDPRVFAVSLSNGESWSIAQRWSRSLMGNEASFALMLRPSKWLSVGAILDGAVRGHAWKTPESQLGIMFKPFGENNRIGGSLHLDQNGEHKGSGLQWFSKLFQQVEAGFQWHRDVITNNRFGLLTLRTLSPFSIGGGFGSEQRDAQTYSVSTLSARLRYPSAPTVPLSGRATIATVEVSSAREYMIKGWLAPESHAPFLTLLQTLDALQDRKDVRGVLLKFSNFDGGWAQSEELRARIVELKAKGKKVYAFLPFADIRTYTIATAADVIITTPTGGYDLTGPTTGSLHIKSFLDSVGVEAQFVTTGAFKTAPETFTRARPSAPTNQTQNAILDTLHNSSRKMIAAGRQVPLTTVDEWIKSGVFSGSTLKTTRLVDKQLHLDETEKYLRSEFGGRTRIRAAKRILKTHRAEWGKRRKIAVLYAVGSLLDGKTPTGFFASGEATGSTTFLGAIRQIARDQEIIGVVVRVNSPGGTISASDTMWRALRRLSRKKPVVVSLSNVAASGGYYTAVGTPLIYASERTLTGSIGVFAGKFNFAPLLAKWGIINQTYSRGPLAGLSSPTLPWSDEQRAAMQRSIDDYDSIFQARVALGRKLDKKTVQGLAAGRVYMGTRAKQLRLVDHMGGLSDTILELKARLGLPNNLADVEVFPEGGDDGRNFSLPTLLAGTRQPSASYLGPLKALMPQFTKILPLILTLSKGEVFALDPEIWLMK